MLQGQPPLHIVAVRGGVGTLESLLQHNADVNSLDGEVRVWEGCCYRVIKPHLDLR